jgi:hypothetical protein
MIHPILQFDVPPYRSSGIVYGTLLNSVASLASLGDAVNAAPYKAPPKAPVLYVKPRNTLRSSSAKPFNPVPRWRSAGGAMRSAAPSTNPRC